MMGKLMIKQPPSGGCVLKLYGCLVQSTPGQQPPSGGCVLKQQINQHLGRLLVAAAFARLCVETPIVLLMALLAVAAAFARLCVETCRPSCCVSINSQPPSRGCVLKRHLQ